MAPTSSHHRCVHANRYWPPFPDSLPDLGAFVSACVTIRYRGVVRAPRWRRRPAYSGRVTGRVPPRITLISKPGCHLCDQAREVIERVARDVGVQWVERSILDDAELSAAYSEQIPVTLVDGAQHDYWRVDESRLRVALGNTGSADVPGR